MSRRLVAPLICALAVGSSLLSGCVKSPNSCQAPPKPNAAMVRSDFQLVRGPVSRLQSQELAVAGQFQTAHCSNTVLVEASRQPAFLRQQVYWVVAGKFETWAEHHPNFTATIPRSGRPSLNFTFRLSPQPVGRHYLLFLKAADADRLGVASAATWSGQQNGTPVQVTALSSRSSDPGLSIGRISPVSIGNFVGLCQQTLRAAAAGGDQELVKTLSSGLTPAALPNLGLQYACSSLGVAMAYRASGVKYRDYTQALSGRQLPTIRYQNKPAPGLTGFYTVLDQGTYTELG